MSTAEAAVDVADASGEGGTVLSLGEAARAANGQAGPATEGVAGRTRQLGARVAALPLMQKMALGAAFVLMAAILMTVLFNARTKDDYRVLFSNVAERDGAAIIAALQQQGVPYRFTEGGGAIMVPGPLIHELRLKLAGQGLPKSGTVGFELLENQKLGTSQFVEQLNYQRGLEGELAKTIQSVSQVQAARVHLAIPKQSAFSRDAQKPTASVVLTLHPGRFLDETQVIAITRLVSAAVPQLAPELVTVMDSGGGLLAPNPARSMPGGLDAAQLKYVAEIEGAIAKRIAAIVEPVVGRDNVRAQVSVDMDFAEVDRTEETFRPNSAPEKSAMRSQQSVEASGTTPVVGGIPGALSNQPPMPAQAPIEGRPPTQQAAASQPAAAAPGQPATQRRESTVNYEVDRAIQTTKAQRGTVKRLSAAVVVNYKKTTEKGGKAGAQPFSADEVRQINQLVRDAMGFNGGRGDSVSVANIPFTPEPVEETPPWRDGGVLEMGKTLLQVALLLGVAGFVFLGVVRPILFPPPEPEIDESQRMDEEFDEKLKAELALMSPQAREKRRLEIQLERERRRLAEEEERMRQEEERLRLEEERRRAEEDRKRLDEEKQREYEDLMAYAKDYVGQDARVVAAVFKDWLGQVKNKDGA